MFNLKEMANGTPEQQHALCEIAARLHKAERRRMALAKIAVDEFEPGDPKSAVALVDGLHDACGIYHKAQAEAFDEAFKEMTGTTVESLTDKFIDLMQGHGIVGFSLGADGEVVPMGPSGPLEEVSPETIMELIETMSKVPGMIPGDLQGVVERYVADHVNEEVDAVPVDAADTSWLSGIDLTSVRDFDGNVE